MVVNAPQSNILSTAEHTMALLLAQARNIPQAHAALVGGPLGARRSGRASSWPTRRSASSASAASASWWPSGRSAFGMRLVAYDPFVAPERARQINVELVEPRRARAPVPTSSPSTWPRRPRRSGMIGKELLAKAKPGLRIINVVARRHHRRGRAGRGHPRGPHRRRRHRRVRRRSRPPSRRCSSSPQVVVTPHLGASTAEAQDKAGDTIAEQVGLALAGDFVPFAVNVARRRGVETVRPFLPLAERLGAALRGARRGRARRARDRVPGPAGRLRHPHPHAVGAQGRVRRRERRAGVSYVNAPAARRASAASRCASRRAPTSHDYVNLVTVRGGDHAIAGTLVGLRGEPRIVMVDDHSVDVPPADHMLVVRNDDVPGMIAAVTGALGEAGVNIDDMHLGQLDGGRGRPA